MIEEADEMTAFAATRECMVVVKNLVHEGLSADSEEMGKQRSFLRVNMKQKIAVHVKLVHKPLRPQLLQRDVEDVMIVVEDPPENLYQHDRHTQMGQERWEPRIQC